MQMARQLQQLVTYVQRQWIDTGNATTSGDLSDIMSDRYKVCPIQARAAVTWHGIARRHSRFCVSCADTVASMDSSCPIRRIPIRIVL